MIPPETIDQIREATDIIQVIGEYIRLKKRGRNSQALCPFHTEKTPSFKVSADKQIYHCFGCGKGGNVFTFLMEHEKMSFIEAVRHLAHKANIPIREEVSDYRREQLERLNYAQQVALDYFRELLFDSKYHRVLDYYLKGRRVISDESIEFFQLGLAGEEWDGFLRYATKKGIKSDELLKAGLVLFSEKKKNYFDRFRQRLMIPIFNLSQKPIAFGGRTLRKGEPAKYINSPETPLYSKSNVLYGLNFTRDSIREANAVIVVEGYFDLISLWQSGVKNVVASSGTSFTHQQARLLARFAEEVYLFFDADSAGQTAALRSVDSLYDAGLEVKVMIPPDDLDPDLVAREFGPDKIDEIRHDALAYIQFRARGIDMASTGIIAREKLVKELGAVGEKITDPTRRSLFFQEAAEALRVDISIISKARPMTTSRTTESTPKDRHNKVETEFLSLLLSNPGAIDTVFEQIAPDDFDSRQLARLYSAMITQYEADGSLNANRLIEHFQDEESISLLTGLAAIDWPKDTVEHETRERTKDFIDRKQKRIRSKLQQELARAEAEGDRQRAEELLEQMKQHGL